MYPVVRNDKYVAAEKNFEERALSNGIWIGDIEDDEEDLDDDNTSYSTEGKTQAEIALQNFSFSSTNFDPSQVKLGHSTAPALSVSHSATVQQGYSTSQYVPARSTTWNLGTIFKPQSPSMSYTSQYTATYPQLVTKQHGHAIRGSTVSTQPTVEVQTNSCDMVNSATNTKRMKIVEKSLQCDAIITGEVGINTVVTMQDELNFEPQIEQVDTCDVGINTALTHTVNKVVQTGVTGREMYRDKTTNTNGEMLGVNISTQTSTSEVTIC